MYIVFIKEFLLLTAFVSAVILNPHNQALSLNTILSPIGETST